MSAFKWSGVVLLASALSLVIATLASAQTAAWPGETKPAAQQQAWPGDARASQQPQAWPSNSPPAQQPQAWPGGGGPSQPTQGWPGQQGRPGSAPMMMPPQMGAAPPAGADTCATEFMRLRGEVEKQGKVAKAVSDRKGTREEMCSAISGIYGAQVRWVKYAREHTAACRIPPPILKELRKGEDHLAMLKKNVCSGGGGPAAPSLSQALGTADQPVTADDSAKRRGGVFDTLSGTPIR